jgi:hypothetical protein
MVRKKYFHHRRLSVLVLTLFCAFLLPIYSAYPVDDYWGVHLSKNLDENEISYSFDSYGRINGSEDLIVTTPTGEHLPVGTSFEEPDLSRLENRFQNGTYTFSVSGQGGAYSAELGGIFPGQFPNVTASQDPGGDWVLSWDSWTIDRSLDSSIIGIWGGDYYEELSSDLTSVIIPADQLDEVDPGVTVTFKNYTDANGGVHGDKGTYVYVDLTDNERVARPVVSILPILLLN